MVQEYTIEECDNVNNNYENIPKDLNKGLQWLENQINQRTMVLYMPTYRDNIDYNPKFTKEEISNKNSALGDANSIFKKKI